MAGHPTWFVRIAGTRSGNTYVSEEDAIERGVKILNDTGHGAELVHWDGAAWRHLRTYHPDGAVEEKN